MRYAKTVLLKSGVELLVRNAVASDARAVRDIMQRTHAETDYLLSYPDEQSVDDEQEARSLAETERSDNEVELVAASMGGSWGAQESRRWAVGASWLTGRALGSASSKITGGWGSAEWSWRRVLTVHAGRVIPSLSSM